jgi:DnaJ-domain-containing protein 1
VVSEALTGLPSWLVIGVLLGLGGSLLVAAAFLAANRLLPGQPRERAPGAGESRRRVEFREYLDAIEEPYAEDHVVDGQAVAFYLPDRDVAVTFDARAYYHIKSNVHHIESNVHHIESNVHPVLVEHEVPGAMFGDRLPFETPEIDVDDGAGEDDALEAAFAELGVPAGATIEEVRRAYRQRIKEVHPDQGGDEEAFRRVREAYATAKRHVD